MTITVITLRPQVHRCSYDFDCVYVTSTATLCRNSTASAPPATFQRPHRAESNGQSCRKQRPARRQLHSNGNIEPKQTASRAVCYNAVHTAGSWKCPFRVGRGFTRVQYEHSNALHPIPRIRVGRVLAPRFPLHCCLHTACNIYHIYQTFTITSAYILLLRTFCFRTLISCFVRRAEIASRLIDCFVSVLSCSR